MKIGQTLMFTGVWFWAGVLLLAWSAYALITFEPPPPLAGPFESPFAGKFSFYAALGGCVIGAAYVLVGWSKARGCRD